MFLDFGPVAIEPRRKEQWPMNDEKEIASHGGPGERAVPGQRLPREGSRRLLVLSMDYLAGPTLRDLLRRGKASIQTLIDVLEGLGRLYGSTSFQYHGDLKPENIIVSAAGPKTVWSLKRTEELKWAESLTFPAQKSARNFLTS
jgi:serine/threonine protein kinase